MNRPGAAALAARMVLCLLACGCRPVEKAPPPPGSPAASARLVEVAQGAQATVGDLRIGLGYARVAEFTDESGAARRGLVAGLWLFLRDDPSKDKKLEAHAGRLVRAGSYSVYVEEIRGGRKALVRLRVEEPRP